MNIIVDGAQYIIGCHFSGPDPNITFIRYTTEINNEVIFLDDVSGTFYSEAVERPEYTKKEQLELVASLEGHLEKNIKRIVDSRASNRRD
jgi:hypothetical protein